MFQKNCRNDNNSNTSKPWRNSGVGVERRTPNPEVADSNLVSGGFLPETSTTPSFGASTDQIPGSKNINMQSVNHRV